MNRLILILVVSAFVAVGILETAPLCAATTDSAVIIIESPDKQVQVHFQIASYDGATSTPYYSVFFRGKALMTTSTLGLDPAPAGPLDSGLEITGVERRTSDTTYTLFPGKTSTARDHYNEAVISLAETTGTLREFDIIFRAYDDGAAFRYSVPEQPALDSFTVAGELTTFRIAGNPIAYTLPLKNYTTSYEAYYESLPVEAATPGKLLGLPLLMQYPDETCMAITEAHLHDYAGMYLTATTGTAGLLICRLSPLPGGSGIKVKADLPHATPWRVILIGDHPGRLIESNLVANLNPPSVISDSSWIKPGITTFPWWNGFALGEDVDFEAGLNTETMKHYIDFCADAGFEYHSLDGFDNIAWYGGPIRPYKGASITASTLPDMDLAEVLRHADEKKVKLRFWMHWEAARKHMKQAFPIYEKWGIEGIMLDFIDRDDQEIVNFIDEVTALAAKHHLTVTLHGIYKPTGMTRTYPNLLTYEGVRNLEYNKWKSGPSTPDHELTVPFTRMLAGPLDYHSGGFRHVSLEDFEPRNVAPLVIGTRARELARYVVNEGYLPMAADYPAAYRGEAGLDMLAKIPTYWDETRVLEGAVGDHITIARRSGKTWYVGSMTDGSAREIAIPLTFLGSGDYNAEIFADDTAPGAERKSMKTSKVNVTATETMTADLIPAGGHLVVLTPE